MTKSPSSLQDLRRRIYVKAKAEPTWCFWGLYVHVCKRETLQAAYQIAKSNNGAPGIDGITFEVIEESGVESFLKQIQDELVHNTYRPLPVRKKEIPKDGGSKVRVLSIPAIRDRVVQGALKLILEPIFEADFHHNVQHSLLLGKVARRVQDATVMRLLKMILKSTGAKGVPQGGVISPMLSNLYLTEVDRMLEKAIATTRRGKYPNVQYARFADDLVVLIDSHPRHEWLMGAVEKRLREELAKLRVEINEEKSRKVDLSKGGSFGFLGFEYRRIRSRKGKWRAHYVPKLKKRTALLRKLKDIFRRYVSQPVGRMIELINPILRGWVHYFAVGDSSRCFSYIKLWVEKKVRRHLMRARGRQGFGWKRWSTQWLYNTLGLFHQYRVARAIS
jgi:RNA-directed DNA polymerase